MGGTAETESDRKFEVHWGGSEIYLNRIKPGGIIHSSHNDNLVHLNTFIRQRQFGGIGT
jgi:hypothetical protein